MTIDTRVALLAEEFVDDEYQALEELDLALGLTLAERAIAAAKRRQQRETLITRAAHAMQQAIENECEAIRQELTT